MRPRFNARHARASLQRVPMHAGSSSRTQRHGNSVMLESLFCVSQEPGVISPVSVAPARAHKRTTSPDSAAATRERGDSWKYHQVSDPSGNRISIPCSSTIPSPSVGSRISANRARHVMLGIQGRYANGAVARSASKHRIIPRGRHTPDTPESSRPAHARVTALPDRH